jgi:hypothetical protein
MAEPGTSSAQQPDGQNSSQDNKDEESSFITAKTEKTNDGQVEENASLLPVAYFVELYEVSKERRAHQGDCQQILIAQLSQGSKIITSFVQNLFSF